VPVPASPLTPVRGTFHALTATVVPDAAGLDERGWERLDAIVGEALATRPPSLVRQLRLFVRVVDLLPLLRHGRTFRGLSPARRLALLERLERSRLRAVRRGVWGVRTLAFMGYYGQDDVRRRIGYRAHPDGWDAASGGPVSAAPGAADEGAASAEEP